MRFRIILKSFDKEKINSVSKAIKETLVLANCKVNGIVALPIRIRKFCVLRSPHVDKDSREHFEVRIYKQLIDVMSDSASIINLLLKLEIPSEISSSIEFI